MINNNLSPIPFYSRLAEQDFKKWYAYGQMYPNRVSQANLIPFFFTTNVAYSISTIQFYGCCDTEISGKGSFSPSAFSEAFNSGSALGYGATLASHIGSVVNGNYKTFFFTAPLSLNLGLKKGFYYIKITLSNTSVLYSDIFYADDTSQMVKVAWYDELDLSLSDGGIIPYSQSNGSRYYGNYVFFDTEIGMPEYNTTEDGEERDGHFFPIKIISEKTYKFRVIVPEYMCDCMRIIGLSDVVRITDQYGRIYDVEHFSNEVSWLDGGWLADVECSFETDSVVKKIGRAYGTITSR